MLLDLFALTIEGEGLRGPFSLYLCIHAYHLEDAWMARSRRPRLRGGQKARICTAPRSSVEADLEGGGGDTAAGPRHEKAT